MYARKNKLDSTSVVVKKDKGIYKLFKTKESSITCKYVRSPIDRNITNHSVNAVYIFSEYFISSTWKVIKASK